MADVPGAGKTVLKAQAQLFLVEEPVGYDLRTRNFTFAVDLLPAHGSLTPDRIILSGDAADLADLARELQFVASGSWRSEASRSVGQVARGGADLIFDLAEGIWALLRHPIVTAKDLWAATVAISDYVWRTSLSGIPSDVEALAQGVFAETACEIAEEHGLNYFELRTAEARSAINAETSSRIGGRIVTEIAALFIPFQKIFFAENASRAASAARSVDFAEAATGELRSTPRFDKYDEIFPTLVAHESDYLSASRAARSARAAVRPVAGIGHALDLDYRATFARANPAIADKVIVHHAVEQSVLIRYPGLFTPEEIQSLENLRGIPKELNSGLHLSELRKEWNEFYRAHSAASITRKDLLDHATAMDRKYGHYFIPQVQ